MRGYLGTIVFLACCIAALGIVGCVSSGSGSSTTLPSGGDHRLALQVAEAMTNASPVLAAAGGAASAIPGAQPLGLVLGALSALLAAAGGFLARHYAGVGPKNQPPAQGQ